MASSGIRFTAPYFTNTSPVYRLLQAFSFGLFVFLFLLIFKPFRIDGLGKNLVLAASGFGGVTFFAMVLLNVIIPQLFKNYFDEANWTVGREIFYTLLNLWLIGVFNFIFFNFFFGNNFSFVSFWWFQFVTVSVGVFPVVFITFIRERQFRKKFTAEAMALTGELAIPGKNVPPADGMVTIPSQNINDDFTVLKAGICLLKAADNYVEVYYFDGALKKKILRNTLKQVESLFSADQHMFRCHKSYLVNLRFVEKISGNAQGYKLHLKGYAYPVPVSRQYNAIIKDRFTVRP